MSVLKKKKLYFEEIRTIFIILITFSLIFLSIICFAHDEKITHQMECLEGYVFKTTYARTKYVTAVSTIQLKDNYEKPIKCVNYKGKNLIYINKIIKVKS